MNDDGSVTYRPDADYNGPDSYTYRVADGLLDSNTVAFNADGTFTYTPAHGFHGTDSFTYKVNDGRADSNIVTVSFTIASGSHAPTAADSLVAGVEDTVLTLRWSDFNVADADGDALTITITALPAGLRGSGDFFATVTADCNASGVGSLFETNVAGKRRGQQQHQRRLRRRRAQLRQPGRDRHAGAVGRAGRRDGHHQLDRGEPQEAPFSG